MGATGGGGIGLRLGRIPKEAVPYAMASWYGLYSAQSNGGGCAGRAGCCMAACAHCGRSAVVTLLLGLAGAMQERSAELLAVAGGGGAAAPTTSKPVSKAQRGGKPMQSTVLQ